MPAAAAAPASARRRCLLLVLLAATVALAARAAGSSLPEGLDDKPLLEQLLARKAHLAEHLRSQAWTEQLQQREAAWAAAPSNTQRGVLIVAGGRDMFANAAITLRVLRHTLRSSVPVEVVHFGAQELPPPQVLALFTALNGTAAAAGVAAVTAADGASSLSTGGAGSAGNGSSVGASSMASGLVFITDGLAPHPHGTAAATAGTHHRVPPGGITGFAAKVYALTHVTRFKQVLLLDADSMPLVDPAVLFSIPLFQRSGCLLWPDLWHSAWVNETIYSLVGGMAQAPWVGKHHHRLVDSGQMLLDRARHAEVLEHLWLLNSHHEWVYTHMHGDKDTFLLAFAMAGRLEQFRQVPCFAREALREVAGHEHGFHHLGMVQSLPPAMLAAAVRAAGRAKQQQQQRQAGGNGNSSSLAALGRKGGRQQAVLLADARVALSSSDSLRQPTVELSEDAAAGSSSNEAPAAAAAAGVTEDLGRAAPPAPSAAAAGGNSEGVSSQRGTRPHVGVPVFFHRTSFNGKFFPHCLADGKAESGYCEVQWVSVPLSDAQAGHALKPHIFAFDASQVDTTFYQQHCNGSSRATSGSSSGTATAAPVSLRVAASVLGLEYVGAAAGHSARHIAGASRGVGNEQAARTGRHRQQQRVLARHAVGGTTTTTARPGAVEQASWGTTSSSRRLQQLQQQPDVLHPPWRHWRALGQYGLPPEHTCDRLPVGEDVPIPVLRVELFRHMQGVLAGSYQAFAHVRAAVTPS